MTEERKNRLIWGVMLLIGALGAASLRNNPALAITPLAIGMIEGVIFACLLAAVALSNWRMATLIALVTPVYLWIQQFLDGFMIPVDMLMNLTLVGCMYLMTEKDWPYLLRVAVLAIPAFCVMLLSSAAAIWFVKGEHIMRALIVAWNTDVYSGLSILGAASICALFGDYKKPAGR